MPYLRVNVSLKSIEADIHDIYKSFMFTLKLNNYLPYYVSVLLMMLFGIIEDIISFKCENEVISRIEGDEEGSLFSGSEFMNLAVNLGIVVNKETKEAL